MKKNFSIAILIFLLLLINISCHHNRLKTNEKELAKEILVQEKTKHEAEKTAQEMESSETKNRSLGSFQKKEIRSVDKQRPPVKIDIMGTLNNTRKLRLSDVASSIRYVKLQTPPDTTLIFDNFFYRDDLMSTIRSDGEEIIFQGLFGITRFNMQGKYQETIWKNERGIKVMGQGAAWMPQSFFGVMPNNPVSILNGNIFYTFTDGNTGTTQYMRYKPGSTIDISVQSQKEVPGLGSAPGDTLSISGMQRLELFDWIYGISSDTWAGINSKTTAGETGSLLVTYNSIGDTICQFTDFDRIVNFSHGSYRSHAKLTSYYFNELVTIKPEYNDTVFRLIPPNRLLPVYVIDFGEYKVNYMDGLNPDFDLSEKYMLYSLHESNNHLFIRFTKNHDGPTNRKKKVAKFYNAIFFKKEGKLFHHPGYTLAPEGLTNDLDGGIPFWPEFITPQGEMMKLVSGRVFKDYVNSEDFKKSTVSKENKQKQISMASGLRPTDMVVVIVK